MIVFIQGFINKVKHNKLCMHFIGEIYVYMLWVCESSEIKLHTLFSIFLFFKVNSIPLSQAAQEDILHSFGQCEILEVELLGPTEAVVWYCQTAFKEFSSIMAHLQWLRRCACSHTGQCGYLLAYLLIWSCGFIHR